ncbi:MAG: hypothetical protein IJT04_04890 [Bacteroidales bacterium]|nr:hypothetical protein [Bacteroidales bacterium]
MKKLKWLTTTLLVYFPLFLFSQFYDDFSDGNFSDNPIWSGDTGKFMVNEQKQLQLWDNGGGVAQLSLNSGWDETPTEWRISVKMSFAPSDRNYACIYLCANSADFQSDSLKGFFLKMGESGAGDVVELFYQENGQCFSVFRGLTSIAAAFSYNIKVTKDATNLWRLYIDAYQNGAYQEEVSAYGYFNASDYHYFGIKCCYTSTNANRFFFDNIYSGPPCIDTILPHLQTLDASDEGKLLLIFDKAMDSSLTFTENFVLVNEQVSPIFCEWGRATADRVVLYFDTIFQERVPYELLIRDLYSWNGLPMHDTTAHFCNYHICRNEIIVSELMAVPNPPVQLPACEYIELFNRLPLDVTLSHWTLRIGNAIKYLPDIFLPPRSAVCIVPANYQNDFMGVPNVVAVSSLGIADEEQVLSLYDAEEKLIYHLHADRKWHTHSLKRLGGWSLEIMDVDNPCGGKENWASSEDVRGGTPGMPNSVAAENHDWVSPVLEKIVVQDEKNIRVFFDEPLYVSGDTLNPMFFSIDRGIVCVSAKPIPPDYKSILLTLSEDLEQNLIYTLTINGLVEDCVGNMMHQGLFGEFALPNQPVPNDIIINELLFNSFESTDAPYIELYNRSDKVIDIGNLYLGVGNGDYPKSVVPMVEDGWQLFPKQYVAICKDKSLTGTQYIVQNPKSLVENPKFPVLPNSGGTVHILTPSYEHIDQLTYDEKMHYNLLQSVDGVSLERLHFDSPTQESSNWKSAAGSAGWGTPGYLNSQFSELASADEIVQVVPPLFSPDNDGFDDYVEIYCSFTEAENRVSIAIYDPQGYRIKVLSNNQICGMQERFVWDGMADNGSAVANNLYVVKIDWWNKNGKHRSIKRCVALARRL